MTKGSTAAEKIKWRSLRATPRRLTPKELHQRAVARRDLKRHMEKLHAEMAKATKAGDKERRVKRREKTRAAFALAIQREREIGTDPIYHNRNGSARLYDFDKLDPFTSPTKAWKKLAKAWDIAHQPKPEAEAA